MSREHTFAQFASKALETATRISSFRNERRRLGVQFEDPLPLFAHPRGITAETISSCLQARSSVLTRIEITFGQA